MKRATEEGVEGLKHKPPPGAAPRLSEEERAKLAELLAHHDAEAYGFRGKVWTCERVAELIHREFGVRYHPAHVSRLLRALGFSLQKSLPAGPISATRKPSNTGKRIAGPS
jgi:transposase